MNWGEDASWRKRFGCVNKNIVCSQLDPFFLTYVCLAIRCYGSGTPKIASHCAEAHRLAQACTQTTFFNRLMKYTKLPIAKLSPCLLWLRCSHSIHLQIMKDKARLIRRTQTKRSNYKRMTFAQTATNDGVDAASSVSYIWLRSAHLFYFKLYSRNSFLSLVRHCFLHLVEKCSGPSVTFAIGAAFHSLFTRPYAWRPIFGCQSRLLHTIECGHRSLAFAIVAYVFVGRRHRPTIAPLVGPVFCWSQQFGCIRIMWEGAPLCFSHVIGRLFTWFGDWIEWMTMPCWLADWGSSSSE